MPRIRYGAPFDCPSCGKRFYMGMLPEPGGVCPECDSLANLGTPQTEETAAMESSTCKSKCNLESGHCTQCGREWHIDHKTKTLHQTGDWPNCFTCMNFRVKWNEKHRKGGAKDCCGSGDGCAGGDCKGGSGS